MSKKYKNLFLHDFNRKRWTIFLALFTVLNAFACIFYYRNAVHLNHSAGTYHCTYATYYAVLFVNYYSAHSLYLFQRYA